MTRKQSRIIIGIMGLVVIGVLGAYVRYTHLGTHNAVPSQVTQAECNPPTVITGCVALPSTPDWKIYHNQSLGFWISYPPSYTIEVNPLATGTPWVSMDLMSINATDTSSYKSHAIPVHVALEHQLVIGGGEIYHTIQAYQQSGIPARMENGISNPNGVIMTVNDIPMLRYQYSSDGTATDAPTDDYFFIHNDFIYKLALNANDPYRDSILWSIRFDIVGTAGNFAFTYPSNARLSGFGWEDVVMPGNYQINGLGADNGFNTSQEAVYIFTTGAPLSSINPNAKTLDEYRVDYPLSATTTKQVLVNGVPTTFDTREEVRIISSEDMIINNIPMLRQLYSVGERSLDANGNRVFDTSMEGSVGNELRYVFFDGKTFVVITGWQADAYIDQIARSVHLLQ